MENRGGIRAFNVEQFCDVNGGWSDDRQTVVTNISANKCMGAPVFINSSTNNWIYGFINPVEPELKNEYLMIPGPIIKYVLTHDINDENEVIESDVDLYPVLSADNNAYGPKYVINGGGKENTYLNW
jgi:hypothetical protein